MSGAFNNMLHFVGVVEDNYDKTNAGRVRVRAFGIHPPRVSDDIEDNVPTRDLPWATVLDGTYGLAPLIPKVGDWVFGFFIDGREAQQPMIIGRLPGMHMNLPGGTGEAGEDGYLPPESIHSYGKPELHRYIGGEDMTKGQTLLQASSINEDITQALSEETFDEPPIAMPENNYNNRVLASKSGDNFIVMGDGDENESSDYILLSHSSGSVFQIDPNGTIFIKSFADQYNTTEGVLSTFVKGSSHTNIQEDYTLKVEQGGGKVYINGDFDIECENFNVTARSNMNLHAGVKTNISAGGISVLASADDINMGAKGSMKFKTGDSETLGGFYVQALDGDFHIDTYKTNMLSKTYTKISSEGTPCVSEQVLPYPDSGHKGVEINSADLVHIEAPKASMTGTDALSLDGGVIGIKSSGNVGITGGTVGIDDTVRMAEGNGTGTANSTYSTTDGNRATQKPKKDAQVSVTEVATVMSPGELPKSRAQRTPVIQRVTEFITGLME